MIVDTSALIAILRDEPEAEALALTLAVAQAPRISAANYLATAIVIDASRDPIASRHVDDLVTKARLVIEPVTADQAAIARAAYRDFGKGSGHPAQLNFGDCFAYALASAPTSHCFSRAKISARPTWCPPRPRYPSRGRAPE